MSRSALLSRLVSRLALGGGLLMILLSRGAQASGAPAAVSLTVNNPACVQIAQTQGACQIVVRSASVSGDSTLLALEVSVNGKVRARVNAFFENNISLNQKMLGDGLQVACGGPGSGGGRELW
jgi:hypothetical protein